MTTFRTRRRAPILGISGVLLAAAIAAVWVVWSPTSGAREGSVTSANPVGETSVGAPARSFSAEPGRGEGIAGREWERPALPAAAWPAPPAPNPARQAPLPHHIFAPVRSRWYSGSRETRAPERRPVKPTFVAYPEGSQCSLGPRRQRPGPEDSHEA